MSKKVEDIYKKVTQIEHILLRPDTYIGTIEANDHEMWIWEDPETMQFAHDSISYCNGLFKIFDEILVNAADNFQRDKKTDRISVTIKNDLIIVENTGQGIPIEIHKEHKIYVPELIFGNLLTSSNYDDNEQKVTGGRNGFGAKLTNIFSSYFKVETTDKKQIFTMIWTDNMSKHTNPEIKPYNGQSFTRISFKPDLSKFKMDRLSDIYPLLYKRVMDIAGILPLKVFLNEKRLNIKNFSEYAQLYGVTKYASAKQNRWEVLVSSSDGQFQQVSFVNSINTSRGGTHVNYVTDKIVDALLSHIKKKFKEMKNLKPFQVKSNIKIFVNSLINNPSFDSQTKETLTTKPSLFGSTFELTDSFTNQIIKNTDIVDNILLSAKSKLNKQLSKQLSAKKQQRLLGIEKLEDANDAGTKYGDQCTLILTEGDSAKSLAMAGIEIVGRDKFGVFPLRGKLLNVRDAAIATLMKNQEIEQLVKIIGLQFNKSYVDTKSLRYGSIMIMTDQDHDGHHIKGLIINLFDKFWPSLLKMKGFLKQFITPIIKIQKGKETHSFFSIGDYRKYVEENNLGGEFKVKYYKGLGTSTDEEAQHYFSNLSSHRKTFTYVDQTDSDYIDLAFNKSKADQRKEWLSQYSWEHIQDTLDYSKHTVRYRNFITDCLSMHSVSDNVRSISSLVDGLKPTQRKIMHTLLNHAQSEQKVSSLSGIIMAYAQYHHGEQSLQSTIVAMAQKFTGSNNLNLLLPIGQFGTRSLLGKDAAQARYISSKLNPLSLKLFNEHDLHTLNYLDEEGHSVEPVWFVPILPLALLNGSDGIGTGWSTSIPPHNPRELCEQIKRKLRGEAFEELTPWYRGFTGQILAGNNQYILKGSYIQNRNKVYITEIPPYKSIKEYQTLILSKMDGEDPEVLDLKEYHAGNKVCFEITLAEKVINADIEKLFKLSATQAMTNLVLFGANGLIKKYASVAEIFEEFYLIRLDFYWKRKEYLLSKYINELETLQQKIKFIQAMIDNTIPLRGQKKVEMCKMLESQGFKGISQVQKIQSTKIKKETNLDNIEKQYDYLLGMNIWNFSNEKITEINKKISQLQKQISDLNKQTPEMLWSDDIEDFLQELDKIEQSENIDMIKRVEKNAEKLLKGGSKIIASIVKGKSNGELDQDYQESEEEDSENENEKKNPKIIMKVIKEFANFGVNSKREQLTQKLKYCEKEKEKEKKSKKEQQDENMELEDNMNKSKKAEKQDKLARKNNKNVISDSNESIEIDLADENSGEEVVVVKKRNNNRSRKLQQSDESEKVKEIKNQSEKKEKEQVKKEKEKVEKLSKPIEPLPLTREEKDEQDLYKKYGLGDFLKYLSPIGDTNLADRLSSKVDKYKEAVDKVRQEENAKSAKKEQKQKIIERDELDIENLDFNIDLDQPKQQQQQLKQQEVKKANPMSSSKKKQNKQDHESSFEVMDKKQKKNKKA